jgi:hypothetical protein
MLGRARHPKAASKAAVAKTKLTTQRLWHQVVWGCAAAAALFVAVVCGRSEVGAQRAAPALAALNAPPGQAAARQFDAETAARQFAAAVRGLNEDRDRVARRLAVVTGPL